MIKNVTWLNLKISIEGDIDECDLFDKLEECLKKSLSKGNEVEIIGSYCDASFVV